MVKILYSTYVKSELKQVDNNSTHLNAVERTLLLNLLKYFEEYFGGTLVDWVAELVYLELKSDFKPFNSRYYLVPRINKAFFENILNS